MNGLKTILSELFGLFVDDAGFALAILAWVAVTALAVPRLGLHGSLPALIFFVGLLAILMESALRRAKK